MKNFAVTALIISFAFAVAYAQPGPLDTNVIGFLIPHIRPTALTLPTPLQIRLLALMQSVTWESWSQYTPNAKGFFVGDTYRRPVAEHTIRNKNTAIAYSLHRLCTNYFPNNRTGWDNLFFGVLGLPVNNGSRDPSTPVGVANLCADAALTFFDHDGWNSLGDASGNTYNRMPYQDTTGYEPENDAYSKVKRPDNWQPLLVSENTYFFKQQTFLVPQAGTAKTFAINVRDQAFAVSDIRDSWKHNKPGYRAKVDQVLAASASLDDRKKMLSEYFDNKFNSLGTLTRDVAGRNLDRFVIIETLVNLGFLDGVSLMWYHKRIFDSIRPISAVRWLRENDDVTAYGGPFKGTVTMKGRDWSPYMPTDAHTEYPSGTTCLCHIFAEVIRRYDGSDNLNFTASFPAGSSVREPGATPSQNLNVHWSSLSEMANECSQSRNWAGVHFQQSIDEAARVCTAVGASVYNKFMKYLTGAPDAFPRE